MLKLSEQIRKRRKAKGLTQSELATKLGVQTTTVSMWETGLRTPNIKTLMRLSEVLNCTLNDLL